MWVKTEGKEEEKKGRGREKEKDWGGYSKDIGKDKRQWRSMEVWGVEFICSCSALEIHLGNWQ